MKVKFLLLATYAEIGPTGQLYIMGADFDAFLTASLPILVPSFYVVGKIQYDEVEYNNQINFDVSIIDPDGKSLDYARTSGSLTAGSPRDPNLPAAGGLIVLIQNCLFQAWGIHWLIVRINDEEAARLPIKIESVDSVAGGLNSNQPR
ncbi:hypothetical protein OJF2_24870 [Aquisphaera giovannonii]|uniref:Uncharacterized protein n=1 Tax=Aquisphaera giovannonii TaxID=406548 RepID=A0A5B9W149_9BACT|nr:hypothetical protein [Aquisphaera giovannonii]QEH33954.1 hypothetical protein OJF2_24870 [Aquisphaera giovannonii]